MRVYPDKLAQHLSSLHQCYLLFGDDPWLVNTSHRQILNQAKQQGFEERIQLQQETGFNWQELMQEWQAMSLFSSRRIIELTLPTAKPGTEGSNMLQALMQAPNPDMLLIIQGPKLASEQTKSKWFKSLDANGLYVPCATPEGVQFQRWLENRIQHYQLRFDIDAKSMMLTLYEGNLLAADQALKLLQLLSKNQIVTSEQLNRYFEDQSRFSVFQLLDALLSNQQDKALHMLSQLKGEGTAMPVLLWSLFKELNTLLQLKSAQAKGESLSNMWSKHRIWDKRKALYQGTLARLSLEQIEAMLALTSSIETKLKQQGLEDWTELSHLCLLFDPKAHQPLSFITSH